MAQQLGSNYYNSPYKFNGKELDEETGFYYYGARYYDPRISIWLSVDPLAIKHPNESPYIYCGNNPIIFFDPDGNDRIYSSSGRFLKDDGKKTNLIKVQIGNKQLNLSQLDYSQRNTRKAVSKIIAREAKEKGYTGYYGARNMDGIKDTSPDTGAYTNDKKTVWFNCNKLSDGSYDNFYNLRNSLNHEELHKMENIPSKSYKYTDHAEVYLGVSKTDDFANSTEGDRNSNASGYVTRIVNAYRNNEINSDGLSNLLTKYNEENNGNVKIIPGVLSGNGTLEYNVSVGNTQYQLQRTTILDKPQN